MSKFRSSTQKITAKFIAPIFKINHSLSDSQFITNNEEDDVINALDKNSKKKLEFSQAFFENYFNFVKNESFENENQIMDEECNMIRSEIDKMTQENQEWFKIYEENSEKLEEFYKRRRIILEEYYQKLNNQLKDTNQEELFIEHQLLQIENQLKMVELEKLNIKKQEIYLLFPKASFTDICTYLMLFVIFLLVLYP